MSENICENLKNMKFFQKCLHFFQLIEFISGIVHEKGWTELFKIEKKEQNNGPFSYIMYNWDILSTWLIWYTCTMYCKNLYNVF